MAYDKDNIFYKILHKEAPCEIVLAGKHFIVIKDIKPKAPVHLLVIPKGEYSDYADFINRASNDEILDFNNGILSVIDNFRLNAGGYRLISNCGKFGEQEVPHMHVHVLGRKASD